MAGQTQKQRRKRRGKRITSLQPIMLGGLLIFVVIVLLLLWALNVMEVIQGPWSKLLTIIFGNLYALIASVGAVILAVISANNKEVFQKVFLKSKESAVEAEEANEETTFARTSSVFLPQRREAQPSTGPEPVTVQIAIGEPALVLAVPSDPGAIFFFNEHLPRPEEFYGRTLDCEALLTRVRSKAATSLVGPRRIGKTWVMEWLLHVVPVQLGPHYRIGYVDATLPGCETVADFTACALEQLGIRIVSGKTRLSMEALLKAVDMLKAEHVVPILCIDEFEGLDNRQEFDQDFFSELRAISQRGLGLVTASKKTLFDIVGENGYTSGFFNIFDTRMLAPFAEKEARAFVQAKGMQANLTSREKKYFLDFAWQQNLDGWPPLRLQLTGKMLLEEKMGENLRPSDKSYWLDFKEHLEARYHTVVR